MRLSKAPANFILLFSFFAFFSVHSQNTEEKEKKIRELIKRSRDSLFSNKKEAKRSLNKALSLYDETMEKEIEAEIHYEFGLHYYISGDYELSLKNYYDALNLFGIIKDKTGLAKSYSGLGLIHLGLEEYDSAIHFFIKSSRIKHKKSTSLNSSNFLNIGICQMEQGLFEASKKSIEKALTLSRKAGRPDVEHLSLNRLGHLYLKENQPDSAYQCFSKVLSHSVPPTNWEKSYSLKGLADYYYQKEEFEKAIETGLESYELAEKIGAKWDMAEAAKVLSIAYQKKGNYKKAHEYLQSHIIYSDSILNEHSFEKIKYLQLQQTEAENKQLQLLNEATEQKLINSKILFISSILLIIILISWVLSYRRIVISKENLYNELQKNTKDIDHQKNIIQEQNNKLVNLNQTRVKLLSILSHDLRGPLAAIKQLFELYENDMLSEEEQKTLLKKLSVQVNNTYELLNEMVTWSSAQIDGIQTHPAFCDISELVQHTLDIFNINLLNKNIIIKHLQNNIGKTEAYADEGQVKIIFHNIIANAIKFTHENGTITIYYSETEKFLKVHIKDSGIGISETVKNQILNPEHIVESRKGTNNELGNGLGLMLVKQFLANNKGQMEIVSTPEKGSEFIIYLHKKSFD